ncbi:hypothetical protein GGR56DRAFT_21544 [Xylariaceae sp. FL0804]|nr:hypothetical protein GGR56DRAFT_21544 [Xylariaceae sp. FL0804]
MATPPLPTARALLTSLITSVEPAPDAPADAPPSPPSAAAAGPDRQQQQGTGSGSGITSTTTTTGTTTGTTTAAAGTANPLRQLPPRRRALLAALHALYPSFVLPALDLLDRRLVTRVVLLRPVPVPSPASPSCSSSSPPPPPPPPAPPPALYHLVRSAQPPSSRSRRRRGGGHHPGAGAGGAPTRTYVVRTGAWSCTCASFAFEAHARIYSLSTTSSSSSSSSSSGCRRYDVREATATGAFSEQRSRSWEFGGLSTDGGGEGGSGVPCCKHLLACVLAERWPALLAGFVEERAVGREEAAGLVADL